MRPGSGRGRESADRTRLAGHGLGRSRAAVSAARPSGEWTISSGGPAGTGRAGDACGWASRAATRSAWRSPVVDSGESGLALEAALHDELGLAVADEDERRVEPVGDRGARDRSSGEDAQRSLPSRIVHSSMTDSWSRIASATLARHVVVESQDHQRVGARRATGRGASR